MTEDERRLTGHLAHAHDQIRALSTRLAEAHAMVAEGISIITAYRDRTEGLMKALFDEQCKVREWQEHHRNCDLDDALDAIRCEAQVCGCSQRIMARIVECRSTPAPPAEPEPT